MDRLYRPERFSTDCDSPTAQQEWIHWKRTFDNFIEKAKVKTEDKMKVLLNFLSFNVFEHINECTTYENAVKIIDNLYIKKKNVIYARHRLATRKQLPTETIDQYVTTLKSLAKDCDFKSVSAEENKNDHIRDAFIAGLLSPHIRQRLLENNSLELTEAEEKARSIEIAIKNSQSYSYQLQNSNETAIMNLESYTSQIQNSNDNNQCNTTRSDIKKCFFCGGTLHPRFQCPAKEIVCRNCKKTGHFSKVCRSKKSFQSVKTTAALSEAHELASDDSLVGSIVGASASLSLSKAIVMAKIDGIPARCLIDTGSSGSYMSEEFTRTHRFPILPETGTVSMASTSLSSSLKGCVKVRLQILEHTYNDVKLSILPNLCTDLIVGHDILKSHSRLDLTFGGTNPPLSISSSSLFSPANIEPIRIFTNLSQNVKPIATKSRRHSAEDSKFINDEVSNLLGAGIIEESASPWRAQVLVTKNTNHKRRMVIDYSSTINRFTQLDAYPIPNVEEVISEIANYSHFSTIDLKSAYHQVPICAEDRPYTAFEACGRLYQFTRLPFGVTNGVPAFQKFIDRILDVEKLQGVRCYIDDITVGGRSKAEHDENLQRFLEVAKKYNLKLNEKKCKFACTSIKLLGHLISNGSIKPDPDRLKPLLELPPPSDKGSLQRVVGLFAYYSKWVPRFSEKIRPLIDTQSFPLTTRATKAFEELKKDIADSLLTCVDPNLPLVVETDASDTAISAALTQNGRPVAFFSRTLGESEKRYPAIEKEATAIIESVKKWKHYLGNRHFKLITDQEALSFMFNQSHSSKIKNDKIQRWRLEMSCFSFDIQYRPGSRNSVADALSRVCGATNTDTLYNLHKTMCHPGIIRMQHWVKSKNLPFSLEDIKHVTSACPVCSELKPRFYKPRQNHLIKATRPFERLNIDFKGPVPSSTGNPYILTIVDEYSRFPFAYPCRDMTSATVKKNLYNLFSIFGTPAYIHSDRGTSFLSKELTDYLHVQGIATSSSTPYNPQGNGLVERYNGILWKTLNLALKNKGLDISKWEMVLPESLHAIRSLLCTSTNCTPHERMFTHARRSTNGTTIPSWLANPGKVLMKSHVRTSKYSPLVEEVDLIEANPEYALIRRPDGRESTVSLKHLAPKGDDSIFGHETTEPSDSRSNSSYPEECRRPISRTD